MRESHSLFSQDHARRYYWATPDLPQGYSQPSPVANTRRRVVYRVCLSGGDSNLNYRHDKHFAAFRDYL